MLLKSLSTDELLQNAKAKIVEQSKIIDEQSKNVAKLQQQLKQSKLIQTTLQRELNIKKRKVTP